MCDFILYFKEKYYYFFQTHEKEYEEIMIGMAGQGQGNEHIGGGPMSQKQVTEKLSGEIFLPFHCYCTRKDVSFLCNFDLINYLFL